MLEQTVSGDCPAATMDDLLALKSDVVRCPYNAYEAARQDNPVQYSERLGGWIVTRHDDVLAALRDPSTFSSRLASGPKSVSGLAQRVLQDESLPERTRKAAIRRIELSKSRVLLFSDPPQHKRQRSLVNAAFTHRRVTALHGSIEHLTHQLIDDFPSDGTSFDIVSAFNRPIPMTVIATLLGVPTTMMATFKDWSNAFTRGVGALGLSDAEVIEIFDHVDAFYDFFTGGLIARRERPQDDLLSDVLAARLDGEQPLTHDEILQILVIFLVGGNETTTNLLTSSVLALASDRELQQRLREEPAKLPLFIDEVLRLEGPVQGVWRVTVSEVELGGVTIPSESMVYLVTGSANRDASAFEHADELDLDRASVRHLSFGRGVHVCLGMNLAKLEAKVALDALLARTKRIELADPGATIPFQDSFVHHGSVSLQIKITGNSER